MSNTERTRVNREKVFCRKNLKELAVKGYKSSSIKLWSDGERRRAVRTFGCFSGAGEGWRKVLCRVEGTCEVNSGLRVSCRWSSWRDARQQEGITVRFESKRDCGNSMRLVKIHRESPRD